MQRKFSLRRPAASGSSTLHPLDAQHVLNVAHWTPSKIQKTLTISHLILGGPLGPETEDAGLRCQCLIFDAVG